MASLEGLGLWSSSLLVSAQSGECRALRVPQRHSRRASVRPVEVPRDHGAEAVGADVGEHPRVGGRTRSLLALVPLSTCAPGSPPPIGTGTPMPAPV